MPEFDNEMYMQMKNCYLVIFNSMIPSGDACAEMQDAFNNAIEDFYNAGDDE